MEEKCIFEVIVGTYEEFVLGYKFIKSDKERKLVLSFANHSHKDTVKSVASSGKWLASCSSDETIRLYDMSTRKECGQLMEQNGTITCISFTPGTSHLISASEDGSIAIFKTGNWRMEMCWKKAHEGKGVTYVAVHPSGKMALSLGKNKTLRTWNLVKGRPAYTTNLSRCKGPLDLVVWSKDGNHYAIPITNKIELFSINTAGVTQEFQFKTKVTSLIFINEKLLCVGEESGDISSQCIETGLELWRFSGEKRVKGLGICKKYLVVGCSSGVVSVYKMASPAELPKLITSIEAECRITCLTIINTEKSRKRLKSDEEDSETTNVKQQKLINEDSEPVIIKQNGESSNEKELNIKPKSIDYVNCSPKNQNWFVKKDKKKS